LIRRRQRGADLAVLDTGQFGYLVSRVAQLHPNAGQWTLSRALEEALPALEAVEAKKRAKTGMDFGELVRERRRQRGLPLPVAEKVLPFRASPPTSPVEPELPAASDSDPDEAAALSTHDQVWFAERRLREAHQALEHAERWEASPRELERADATFARADRRLHEVHATLETAEQAP
jgi:hypothetical protein